MALIIWKENERVAVVEVEEDLTIIHYDYTSIEYRGILTENEILKEISKKSSIKKSLLNIQSGIKLKYAWEVDQDGLI